MNKKNKRKAEQEKQQILHEKEQLEKDLEHEREARAKDSKLQQDKKEMVEKEPDPRKTIISGRTKGQAKATQVQFYFENGPLSGQTVLLSHNMTIGRSSSNTVVIEEQTISGQHAKIEYSEQEYILIDLDSTNGTFVNGNKVSQSAIKKGDTVKMGKVKITIK